MTRTRRIALVDEAASTDVGTTHMAAARASVQAISLLVRAHEESGKRQNEIAELLGISEGRVSQILNGDGNVRIATLARVLAATGFDLVLGATPSVQGVLAKNDPGPQITQRRGYVAVEMAACVTGSGVTQEPVIHLTASHPRDVGQSYDVVFDLSTGLVESSDEANDPPPTWQRVLDEE